MSRGNLGRRLDRLVAIRPAAVPPPPPPRRRAWGNLAGLTPDEKLELDDLLARVDEAGDVTRYSDAEIDRLAAFAERCQLPEG